MSAPTTPSLPAGPRRFAAGTPRTPAERSSRTNGEEPVVWRELVERVDKSAVG
jgi:hypothetical protein